MKAEGLGLKDQVRFLAPFFGVLAGIWTLRLLLDASHSPAWLIRLASVNAFSAIAVPLAVLSMHVRGRGGYAQAVVASFLLNAWAQSLIIAAIVFSVGTGIETVYTAPEFSMPGDDPRHLRHIYGHLTFGIGLGSLIGAAVGCLLLLLLRKVVPPRARPGPSAINR